MQKKGTINTWNKKVQTMRNKRLNTIYHSIVPITMDSDKVREITRYPVNTNNTPAKSFIEWYIWNFANDLYTEFINNYKKMRWSHY